MKTGFFSHAVWPLTKSEESSIKASEPKAAQKAPSTPGVPRFAEPAEPEWPENLHGNKHVQWHGSPSGGGGVNYQSPPEQGLVRNGFYVSPKLSGSKYWAVKATIPDKVFQQGIDIGAGTRTEHVADNLTNIFANKRNGLRSLPSKLYSGKTGQIVGDDYKWQKNEPAYRVTPVMEGRELYAVANKSPEAATKARNQSLVWQAMIDHTDAHPGNFFVPKGGRAEGGMWLIDHGGALTHDAMGLPKHHHSYNTWGASMEDHDVLPGLFTLLFQSSKSGNRPSGHELIDQARDIVDTYDANKGMVHSAFTHHPEADQHREIFAKRVDVLRRMIGRYGDDPKALEEKISGFLATASGKAKVIGRPPTRNPNLPGESNNTVKSFAKSAASGKIRDLSDHYNTILTPNEEQEFGQWKTHMEATTGASLGAHDYDIRGAWKSGLKPDGNLHWDDSFKKPNHPTFSSGSMYAQQTQRGRRRAAFTGSEPMGRPPGGEWADHNGDGTHWTYTPSAHTLSVHGPARMLDYFNQHEKGNNVVLGKKLHVGTQGIGKLDRPSLPSLKVVTRVPAVPSVSKSYNSPAGQGKELEKLGYHGKPKEFHETSNFNTLIPYINPDGNIAHSGRFGDHGQFEVHLRPMTEKGDEYEGSGRKHPYLEWAGRKNWTTDVPQAGRQKFHSVLPHLFKEMIGHGYHGDNLHFDVLNPGTDAGDWRTGYFSDIANKWSNHVTPRIEGYTHTQTTLPGSESWGKSIALLFKALGEESRNRGLERHPHVADAFGSPERYPTGHFPPFGGHSEWDDDANFWDGHEGIFGKDRNLYLHVKPAPQHTTHIDGANQRLHLDDEENRPVHPYIQYLQVKPGAAIPGPEHAQQVYEALHRQGYTGDTMDFFAPSDSDGRRDKNGLNRRQRLYRPFVQGWKNFIRAKGYKQYPMAKSLSKSAAWQRKEGQNPKGGLNAKGRASAKREGHNLKPPVKSGDNPRRASFLARMGGSPGPEHDEHGKATRLLLALQAWGASSKADAKKKAAAMSERLKRKKE